MTQIIKPKGPLTYNPITNSDSYKYCHSALYPSDMQGMQAYLEPRGGEFDECTIFSLQADLHQFWSVPFTKYHIEEAEALLVPHGLSFYRDKFEYILNQYGGYWPITIRAIPEGTVVPVSNAVVTLECFDPQAAWCVGLVETMTDRLWYPSTIAIQTREFAKVQKHFLDLSSDTPEEDRWFKVHNFGDRGVTCLEQARIGGSAHLLSFMGTDSVEGMRQLRHFYDADIPGYSINASEHSNVCSWTRDKEKDFYKHFVKTYLTDRQVPPGSPKLAACVSDTYNIFDAVKFWCSPEMRQVLKDSGGTLVIRPDSGEPVETLTKIFALLEQELGDEITVNSKGYKVLPPYIRVIQGDGIDRNSMRDILYQLVVVLGWSATNIAFGSGGGLLQKVNRDTQKWAFKCCAIRVNGQYREVFKDPITDQGKRSKSGRLDLVKVDGQYRTIKLLPEMTHRPPSELVTVFENGQILYHTTLAECRNRMAL